jgi:phosphoribosylamine---glycine ligase
MTKGEFSMLLKPTNILVVDSTGRGHAICDLFVRTNHELTVFYGPGSNAIRHDRIVPVAEVSVHDVRSVIEFCRRVPVEFVFVSFIDALVQGFVDTLRAEGIAVIGPSQAAAQLEASKLRSKHFCVRHGIPTAAYGHFVDPREAKRYIRSLDYPVVIKKDGLCPNGDGAHVCDTHSEAKATVDALAAATADRAEAFSIVVERRLFGQEISIIALLDGQDYLMFPPALDYKRALDGNRGKNCDGMGSIAPHPSVSTQLCAELQRKILDPLMRGLRKEKLDFTGFVFVGVMLTDDGPQVLEINVRFGDSEAEAVLPGIHSDFLQLCRRVLRRELRGAHIATDGLIRCSVAATQGCIEPDRADAPAGWPFGEFESGQIIAGLDAIDRNRADLFVAGALCDEHRRPVTAAGRVVHIVGRGLCADEARQNAYSQIRQVNFRGMRYRSDIGADVASGWSRRHTPWNDVRWTLCLHQVVCGALGTRSSPFAGFLKRGNRRAEQLIDSALIAYFADERDIQSVFDLMDALGAGTPASTGAFAALALATAKQIATSACADAVMDGAKITAQVSISLMERLQLPISLDSGLAGLARNFIHGNRHNESAAT